MIIIGEKINGSIPSMGKAIAERNEEYIKEIAIKQANAGATYIDVCASVAEDIEVETMHWLIDLVQSVTDKPIAVDSPSAEVIAEAYKFCNKPGLLNSVSGEGNKMDVLFPIMKEHPEWECVALLSDDTGIPKSAADRLRVFNNIMAKAKEYDIDPSRLHIDPLIEMLCTAEDGIAMVEEVMETIKSQYPTIHITGAVSNISFNLPYRKILNMGFTVLSMADGLDSAIFDPLNANLMAMIACTEAIMAKGGVTEGMDLSAIAAELPAGVQAYTVTGISADNTIVMEEQKSISNLGGTMRLGAYECLLDENSVAAKAYGKTLVKERHRHRFEFNNDYRERFEAAGMKCVGENPATHLVEVVEIPQLRWFTGTQYHPEYSSTVLHPNPLFLSFVSAAIAYRKDNNK